MKKKTIIISLITLIIIISIYLWARFIGTSGLKVKEYKIEANIKENFHGLKIIHFSDLHYGSTINQKDLNKIVDKINFIKPDIVVFTGDLTDKDDEESLNIIENALKNINVTLGKYAVSGNHDEKKYDDIMKNSGFNVLNNTYDLIYKNGYEPILISGITSTINDKTDISEKLKTTYEYLEENTVTYKILLTHEPDIINKTNIFDLALAGHSHNSQINIPFIKDLVKNEGSKEYHNPYYKVGNTDLYISSGLGTSGVKLRLFNKPSINFYRIVKG